MSYNSHHGWPVEARNKLAKIERLKRRNEQTRQAIADENPEVIRLRKVYDDLKGQLDQAHKALRAARDDAFQRHENRFQAEIEKLTKEAKELRAAVPKDVTDFIAAICHGVSYDAGWQVVWYNKQFLIMRLPGRTYWAGVGMRGYAKSEVRMYDLNKYKLQIANKNARSSGLDLERACRTQAVEGKISAKQLKEWKEQAEFKAT